MDYRTGYDDGFSAGYKAAMQMATFAGPVGREVMFPPAAPMQEKAPVARKRKVSAYSKRYGAAYRRLRRKNTLKSGKLRKGVTHKRLVKMAHAEAKKGGRKK